MHPGLRFRTICVDRSRRVFRGNSMTRYKDREEIAEYFSTTIVLASVQRQHGFSAPFQCSTYQACVGHPSVGGSHRFEDLLRSLIYSACYLLQKQLFLRQEVCTTLTTLQICFGAGLRTSFARSPSPVPGFPRCSSTLDSEKTKHCIDRRHERRQSETLPVGTLLVSLSCLLKGAKWGYMYFVLLRY